LAGLTVKLGFHSILGREALAWWCGCARVQAPPSRSPGCPVNVGPCGRDADLQGGGNAKPEKEEKEWEKAAKEAGRAALWLGVFYNLIFSFYSWVYPAMVKAGLKPPLSLRRSIILHSIVNIILVGVAGVHVIYYWEKGKVGLVEYALIAVALVSVGSGIIMAVVRFRAARRIAALIHLQRVLGLTLLTLAVIHYSIR
jgi:hypothetical protein